MNIGIRKISLHAIKRSMLTWLDSILNNKRLNSCALSGPICYNQDSLVQFVTKLQCYANTRCPTMTCVSSSCEKIQLPHKIHPTLIVMHFPI